MPDRRHARGLTALFAAAVASVAMLLFASSPATASTTPGATATSNVVQIAMQSLHQWEGECFPWVRSVIAQATGRVIGWDYRLGYLQAGAVEVPLTEVQSGDVIQIANDAASGPGVFYLGLHTAIVMEHHGGGTLTVIDSNSQWDGVVRIRTGYNPAVQAARYVGVTARAYRFPDVAAVPVVTTLLGQTEGTAAITAGGTAVVNADGDPLNMRSAPGLGGSVLTRLPHGSVVNVLDGAAYADGFDWRQVSAQGFTGWVAEVYLVALSSTPPSTPEPVPPVVTQPPAPVATPVPIQTTGQVTGTLRVSGGTSLVVWSGGPITDLVANAQGQGCAMASAWTTSGGSFIGYTVGAPAFVNRAWNERYPGGTVANTSALIVVCAPPAGSTPPVTSPPPTTTTPPPTTTTPPTGTSPAPAQPGGAPPGPAGNDD
jgi:uncharacterized protein YraI